MGNVPVKDAKAVPKRAQRKQVKEVADDGLVMVSIPMDHCFAGYATQWLECRTTSRQAAALKVLWSSLSERNERYYGGPSLNPKGTPVENGPSAIRWILDRLADEIEAKTGKELLKDFQLSFG